MGGVIVAPRSRKHAHLESVYVVGLKAATMPPQVITKVAG